MKAIAIDFETANERRESACAVGLAWIEDGAVTRRAYSLVRPPEMRFSSGNVRVHGIRPADVVDAPSLAAALAPHMGEIASTILVAHNAGFDIGVLRAGLAAHGIAAPRLRYLCTRAIARGAWPGERSYGLAALGEKLRLRFRHHHALEDAEACARVVLAAAEAVGTRRVAHLADRLGLQPREVRGAPPPLLRRIPPASPPPRPGSLAFAMRGSTGQRYEVAGGFSRDGYALRCSCTAGLHRRRCRHVTALLDGEIGDLLSENFHDLDRLRTIVQALGIEAVEPAERPRVEPALAAL